MKIIITIPAYNEADTIKQTIENIKQEMDAEGYTYKILIVDDGSKDNTAKIAEAAGAVVYSHPYNYGLAEAFRTEMKLALDAKADIIVHTDADLQYRASEIKSLIEPILDGKADLVLGSRFKGKIKRMPLLKKIGNRAFSSAISRIIGIKVTDCQTGFRAFTKEVAKLKIISTHTYTQEQIIKAVQNKFKIREVPVHFDERISGKSRLMAGPRIFQPFEYAIKAWVNIFRVYRDHEPLKFFGSIGAVFLTLGLILGFYLTMLYIISGSVGHVPATILSMLLVSIGTQIILFGFLADRT